MSRLRDIEFRRAYHKPDDDIAGDFYLPAVAASTRYDRAVGFFSSTIFLLAWPSIRTFVAAGGKMRLICSPVLSEGDHEALRSGYTARAERNAGRAIADWFHRIMETKRFVKPATVLASLVAEGVIDCRLAWVGNKASGRPTRLFHDKLGILADRSGDRLAFKGSMNETWPGLARDGNLESVDVFLSWRDDGERQRVDDEAGYFEQVWGDKWPGTKVRPLPGEASRVAGRSTWTRSVSKWTAPPVGRRTPRRRKVGRRGRTRQRLWRAGRRQAGGGSSSMRPVPGRPIRGCVRSAMRCSGERCHW